MKRDLYTFLLMKPIRFNIVHLIIALSTSILLSVRPVHAQISTFFADSRFEIGIDCGPSNFLGDLGGNAGRGTYGLKDNNFPMTKFFIGAFATVYPKEWIGLRFAINQGNLEGDDNIIKGVGGDEETRKARHLHFKSAISEAYGAIEFYPTVLVTATQEYLPRLRPYGIIGFGVFKFNPKGIYNDPNTGEARWVDLKPLHTEGQGFPEYPERKEYSLIQKVVPMGFGAKYDLNERWTLAFEVLHRTTFTDYVDDVSTRYIDPRLFDLYLSPDLAAIAKQVANPDPQQRYAPGKKRGNPKRNDAYFTTTIRVAFKLGDVYERWFGDSKRQMRCPAFKQW